MRLSDTDRRLLDRTLRETLGVDCEILVFGSRLDDAARGGDVDLLVQAAEPVARKAWTAALLAARAERVLSGRRVDVLLIDPESRLEPIHQSALAQGIPL